MLLVRVGWFLSRVYDSFFSPSFLPHAASPPPALVVLLQNVPVVIVRNKMDTLVAEGGLGERSVDLERQVCGEATNERLASFVSC